MKQDDLKVENKPPGKADEESIVAILNEHNREQGLEYEPEPLSIVYRDDSGSVIGGLIGSTNWGWLRITILAVTRHERSQGLGSKLIELAESEARKRGCKHAFVDTHSFQAVPFYQSLGYKVFAELPDYPAGHKRVFLKKRLQP